jgi:hypothetical protein
VAFFLREAARYGQTKALGRARDKYGSVLAHVYFSITG